MGVRHNHPSHGWPSQALKHVIRLGIVAGSLPAIGNHDNGSNDDNSNNNDEIKHSNNRKKTKYANSKVLWSLRGHVNFIMPGPSPTVLQIKT